MRLDPVIVRRFEELAARADEVAATHVYDFTFQEGVQYFKIPTAALMAWATSVQDSLARTFGQASVHYQNLAKAVDGFGGWESGFETCRAIFLAARDDYNGGYLFDVRMLAKVEVLADAMSQAKELLASGYKDPACVLAGVALEVTLKGVADKHGISHGKLDKMNANLCKAGHATWPSRSRLRRGLT